MCRKNKYAYCGHEEFIEPYCPKECITVEKFEMWDWCHGESCKPAREEAKHNCVSGKQKRMQEKLQRRGDRAQKRNSRPQVQVGWGYRRHNSKCIMKLPRNTDQILENQLDEEINV
jgi:hypothetical protein